MSSDIEMCVKQNIRELKPLIPGKSFEELERELNSTDIDIIKLASNENPIGASKQAIIAIQNSLQHLELYPDASGFELKKALVSHFSHLNIKSDQIILGNGSEEVLTLIAQAFISDGDEIILSQYGFETYTIITKKVGGKIVIVPTKQWGYDFEASLQLITNKVRLVFIANPNNPTGTWVDIKSLKYFLNAVPKSVFVVIDEAYFEYVTESEYPNSIKLVCDFPNLIVTRTFSKIFGLAGLRVGYGISHPEIASLINRIRMPFNISRLGSIAAIAALQDIDHIKFSLRINREGMYQLQTAFNSLSLQYLPSVCNFITVNLGRPALPVYQSLLADGIIVRPLDSYGMYNYLRVTVGQKHHNERFIMSLKKALCG